jgi:hypothetical protein
MSILEDTPLSPLPLSPINNAVNSNNTPCTPLSQPNAVINPVLCHITKLESPVLPQTPDASGPSMQHNLSPLSNVLDVLTPATTMQEIPSRKGKRQASKMDQPKARMTLKAKRKTVRA